MGLFLLLAAGVITTVAGTGERGFSGDGGPASSAALGLAFLVNGCDPACFEAQSHLTVDAAGNIYVADSANNRVRRIAPAGIITTIAGTGERPAVDARCSPQGGAAAAGDNGPAVAARLYGPAQAIPGPGGAFVIVDQKNNRIRQITAYGRITTVAGSNLHAFFAPNIPATSSPLDWPSAATYAPDGSLYFAELHSHRIAVSPRPAVFNSSPAPASRETPRKMPTPPPPV